MTTRITAARKDRGWSQTRLIAELERVGKRRDVRLPGRETLKSRVSRWENGHAKPDEFYRQLLREALGMDDLELGFEAAPEGAIALAAEELRLRLVVAKQVDGTLLNALRGQTEAIRIQDRQYGAGLLLEQMRGHVQNLEGHLAHTVFEAARRPLAQTLADAAALAGWQALDVGGVEQAWRLFEKASGAACQAQDVALWGFARLEQAHVLAELDQPGAAADLAEAVWREVHASVAAPVQCWMTAATADLLSGDGRREEALALIGRAEAQVDRLDDERPPYLVFNAVHLDRWLGHTLMQLGDPSAEKRLRQVAGKMDSSFTRASASLSLDLAASVLRKNEPAEAMILIAEGEGLARQVGSRRQFRRAQKLRAAS